jgi:hypothetical protein
MHAYNEEELRRLRENCARAHPLLNVVSMTGSIGLPHISDHGVFVW